MKGHDKIRRFILQYIKLKYNNYLHDHHIEYIDEGSIEEIVREMYLNNKDALKTYILDSFKDNTYTRLMLEDSILEIFDDEDLCVNRLVLEIRQYQQYKKNHSQHYQNCYDVVLRPHIKYGLGMELAISGDNIEISGFKSWPDNGELDEKDENEEINKKLPAEANGEIQVGDMIIEINHQSFIGRTMEDVVELLTSLGKEDLLFKFQKSH